MNGDANDDAKKIILARRARFVAAAMTSVGIACGNSATPPEAPVSPASTETARPDEYAVPPDAAPPPDNAQPPDAGPMPLPCLSPPPPPASVPPAPCLSPPAPCLTPRLPPDAGATSTADAGAGAGPSTKPQRPEIEPVVCLSVAPRRDPPPLPATQKKTQ